MYVVMKITSALFQSFVNIHLQKPLYRGPVAWADPRHAAKDLLLMLLAAFHGEADVHFALLGFAVAGKTAFAAVRNGPAQHRRGDRKSVIHDLLVMIGNDLRFLQDMEIQVDHEHPSGAVFPAVYHDIVHRMYRALGGSLVIDCAHGVAEPVFPDPGKGEGVGDHPALGGVLSQKAADRHGVDNGIGQTGIHIKLCGRRHEVGIARTVDPHRFNEKISSFFAVDLMPSFDLHKGHEMKAGDHLLARLFWNPPVYFRRAKAHRICIPVRL